MRLSTGWPTKNQLSMTTSWRCMYTPHDTHEKDRNTLDFKFHALYLHSLRVNLIYSHSLRVNLIYSHSLRVNLIYSLLLRVNLIYSHLLRVNLIYSLLLRVNLIYSLPLRVNLIYEKFKWPKVRFLLLYKTVKSEDIHN